MTGSRRYLLIGGRLSNSRTVALTCGAAAVAAVLVGCGTAQGGRSPQTASTTDGSQAAVTYMPGISGPRPTGLHSGVLKGDERSGCLWLSLASSSPRELHLVGPYVIKWRPELVVLVHNRPIARAGEMVNVGGGRSPGHFVSDCPARSDSVVTGVLGGTPLR
jgi:hypothetical protein